MNLIVRMARENSDWGYDHFSGSAKQPRTPRFPTELWPMSYAGLVSVLASPDPPSSHQEC